MDGVNDFEIPDRAGGVAHGHHSEPCEFCRDVPLFHDLVDGFPYQMMPCSQQKNGECQL